jgi:transcription-repair coupling factor (superfamily II helicase)
MNNINKLSTIKKTLTKKFPSIEIDIVHGQMRSEEITLSMQKFKNQNTQILVCTTLVESGIDIPNANTIIIYRADLMGLSQLHQLRGRVGRSNIQAFAYLCIDKDYELEKEAKLRLNALINNQKIGSGFNIAMQDLEIRGAGSLLGAKQSGIIQQIGMATYLKLLNKSISQSDTSKIEHELEVNTLMPSYIPHEYIPHEELRLEFYCKLNRCASQKQLKEFLNETEDRFGTLPEPVKNLIFIYKLKYLFNNTNILSVSIKENYYKIAISQNPKLLRKLFTNIDDKKGFIQFKEPNILKFLKVKDIDNNQNLLDLLNKIITL